MVPRLRFRSIATQRSIVLLLASCFTAGVSAQVTLFSRTYTGLEILNSDNATVASGYTTNGSSLVFAAGTHSDDQVLVSWNLLGAATRSDLTITVTVDFTALTGDNEPALMISDGVYFQGVHRGDNDSGRAVLITGTVNDGYLAGQGFDGTNQTISQNLGTVDPFTYVLNVSPGAGGTTLSDYTEATATGTFTQTGSIAYTTAFIDTSNALSFAMIAAGYNGDTEGYQLNSVGVTITSAVPEPATSAGLIGLLAAGLGLALRARRPRG